MIYFVQDMETKLVKIGWSWNPKERRAHLASSLRADIIMLATEEGERAREMELHQQFSDAKHHGEWFHPVESIRTYVEMLGGTVDISPPTKPLRSYKPAPYKRPPLPPNEKLIALAEKHGGQAEFARKLGISRQSLNRLVRGRSDIGGGMAWRIYKITGARFGLIDQLSLDDPK